MPDAPAKSAPGPGGRPRPSAFVTAPPKRVLFLCVKNAARSQMAEAFARRAAPTGTEVWSAGTKPTGIHPLVSKVMAESGYDLAGHRAKSIEEVPWRDADTIVVLCDEAETIIPPVGPGVRRVHWPLPDPALVPDEAEQVRVFREIRDDIRWRISSLWPSGD